MEETMMNNEVMEQEQPEVEALDWQELPAEPELEGGFDLKSAGIGAAVITGIALVTKYGPRAAKWIKKKFPKKVQELEPEEKEPTTEGAEDADYREAEDSSEEEPPKK